MSKKVDYVLRHRDNSSGHWPGCGAHVPPAMWGCRRHWFMLPKRLRDQTIFGWRSKI